MKLEGNLELFPLRELIEMVAYSSVTGALNIYSESLNGSIFFIDGRMNHVQSGNLNGLEALTEIFVPTRGHFTFVSDVTSEEETVWGDAHFLIHNAELLALRWRKVRATVPSLDATPRLTVGADTLQRKLTPAILSLAQFINGSNSLRQITVALGWAAIDVCEAVADLIAQGYVAIDGPGGQGSEEGSRPPDPRHSRGLKGGLFERLRGRGEPGLGHDTPTASGVA